MGRDKALIEIGGVSMVERAAATLLRAGCDPVVAIGRRHLAASVIHVDDDTPGEGPLGGILTALGRASSSGAPAAMVVACDLPDLDSTTLSSLLATAVALFQPDSQPEHPHPVRRDHASEPAFAVIARSDRLEPLCAVWSSACAPVLQRHFDSGVRAVHLALEGLAVTELEVSKASVRNVNIPDDLRTE